MVGNLLFFFINPYIIILELGLIIYYNYNIFFSISVMLYVVYCIYNTSLYFIKYIKDYINLNIYSKYIKKKKKLEEPICAICLEVIYEEKFILNCNHYFHRICFFKWIRWCINENNDIVCPLCKTDILITTDFQVYTNHHKPITRTFAWNFINHNEIDTNIEYI